MLTDPEFIKKLEMLSLLCRRTLGGSLKADRRSRKKGNGINFADYAEYNLGDDYRNIDWNIYARLENLVVKLFELEEDLSIYVIVDMSPSMTEKSLYARQIAAAISYIALNNFDRLSIYSAADKLQNVFQPASGRKKLFPMLSALDSTEIFGHDTNLSDSIRTFQSMQSKPGVCILISDFLLQDYASSLDYLQWLNNDVFCIQVLSSGELETKLRGDIELRCIETGKTKKVTIGRLEADKYAEAFRNWNESLRLLCAKKGIGFVQTFIEIPFEKVIQEILRRGGLVS